MARNVLITGASGLLGRELAALLRERGFAVTAQFHAHRPDAIPARWIQGDLSCPESTRAFLSRHAQALAGCTHFVHAYGPICAKPLGDLEPEDFVRDLQGNLGAFLLLVRYFLSRGGLETAVSIGFSDAGRIRPYRRVLTHACAKNALLLLTLSLAREYPGVGFNMVSLSTLAGARVTGPGETPLSPALAAAAVADTLEKGGTGRHVRVTPENPRGEVVYEI